MQFLPSKTLTPTSQNSQRGLKLQSSSSYPYFMSKTPISNNGTTPWQGSSQPNYKYTVNPSTQSTVSHGNNKLDINLNISVNNDGSVNRSIRQQPLPSPKFFTSQKFKPSVNLNTTTPSLIPPSNKIMFGSSTPIHGITPAIKTIPNGQHVGGNTHMPFIQHHSNQSYTMGSTLNGQSVRYFQPPPSSNMKFYGQQVRPLGLPFGMLIPPTSSYNGYKPLNEKLQQVNNIPQKKSQPVINIDTTIEHQKVHCVICQQDYEHHDRDEHVKKHKRLHQEIDHRIRNVLKQPSIPNNIRPIVQPQQYNIQYNPNHYILQHETYYQSPQNVTDNQPNKISSQNNFIDVKDSTPPPETINNIPDIRFTRESALNDESTPVVQPSIFDNRQTLQSQDYRESYLIPAKVSAINTPMAPILQQNQMITDSSQDPTSRRCEPQNSNPNDYSALNKQSNQYYSPQVTFAPQNGTIINQYQQSSRNSSSNQILAPSTYNDPYMQRIEQFHTNQLGYLQRPKPPPDPQNFIFENFNYGRSSPDLNVIPRENRKKNQQRSISVQNNIVDMQGLKQYVPTQQNNGEQNTYNYQTSDNTNSQQNISKNYQNIY